MTEVKSTRAAVPPPKRKSSFLPETKEVQPANNMKGEKVVGMTFNMPEAWHREFKGTAVMQGINMKEFLEQCFEAWKREQKAR